MTEYRCPVHHQTDCSPLLNGCVLPRHKAKLHDALVGVAASRVTVAEALSDLDVYVDKVIVKTLREHIEAEHKPTAGRVGR